MEKICKNCKYFKKWPWYYFMGNKYQRCTRVKKINNVTGEVNYSYCDVERCEYSKSPEHCSPDGIYFIEKEYYKNKRFGEIFWNNIRTAQIEKEVTREFIEGLLKKCEEEYREDCRNRFKNV